METSHLDSLFTCPGFGSLHLFPSGPGRRLCNNDWVKHLSMNIAEYFLDQSYVLVLSQVSGISSIWFLVTQVVSGVGSFSMSGPEVKSSIGWILPYIICQEFCSESRLQVKGLWICWCLCFSFGSLQSTFLYQGDQNTGVMAPCKHLLDFFVFKEL